MSPFIVHILSCDVVKTLTPVVIRITGATERALWRIIIHSISFYCATDLVPNKTGAWQRCGRSLSCFQCGLAFYNRRNRILLLRQMSRGRSDQGEWNGWGVQLAQFWSKYLVSGFQRDSSVSDRGQWEAFVDTVMKRQKVGIFWRAERLLLNRKVELTIRFACPLMERKHFRRLDEVDWKNERETRSQRADCGVCR